MFSINDKKAKKNRNKVDKKKKHESIMAAKVFEKMRMRKKEGYICMFCSFRREEDYRLVFVTGDIASITDIS